MKRILVPCDFSEPAIQAYLLAMNMAARTDAEVFLLKVVDLPFSYEPTFMPPYYFDADIIKEIEAGAKANLEAIKNKHERTEKVTLHVVQGPVSFTIRQFAIDHDIDLVIMGTHGASGLKEFFIGSNTEKIVRTSPVPVLAVRESFDLSRIRNIVFPTTLELNHNHFIEKVIEIQSFFSATLHLLLINTPYNLNRTKDEMDLMQEYVRHFKLKNYTLNTRDDFYEQNGILEFVREIKADMIVMGTHSRRGLAHLWSGSVTEDVLNHVDTPIWTCTLRK